MVDYPYDPKVPITVLKIGTFKIKCLPTKKAILNVAAKYKTQINLKTKVYDNFELGIRPRGPVAHYNELCRDGEYKDAVNFWLLRHDMPPCGYNNDNPVPLSHVREFTPGFVVHRSVGITGYDITHLDSGMTCGCPADTAARSIAKFNLIDVHKLQALF